MTLLLTVPAFAGCAEDFQALQDKEKVKLVRDRAMEVHNKRQLRYLIEAELKAVKNYMEFMDFTFDGDNGLTVTTEQYVDKKSEKELGFRIHVTDGTERSDIRYYVKANEENTILYRSWLGQRRAEYICE
jgi:hypothetical protein